MCLVSRVLFVFAFLLPAAAYAWTSSDIEDLLRKMETAYEGVKDYQARLETMAQKEDGSFETKKALYTFKKPHRIRLDFESPYPGMVLVYPDKDGKALVRPSGWARFFRLRLAPDNFLLEVSPGQRIDQTDLGLLIRNISHSLTDGRRGQVEVTRDERYFRISVLADDHFRQGVVTQYQFLIDTKLWLPVGVEESTPDGNLKRKVIFRGLRANIGVSDSFFRPNGG